MTRDATPLQRVCVPVTISKKSSKTRRGDAMEPDAAVRLALNVSDSIQIRSCYTPDIGTLRMWSDEGAFDVCVTRVWRTSEWRVVDGVPRGSCECTIPYRLSLTGQRDFRHDSTHVGRNLYETLARMRFHDVVFHTDTGCTSLLRTMEGLDAFQGVALVQAFSEQTGDGRIRSDICRLAMLWTRGGYYFDNDIVLLDDVSRRLSPDTTFATVTAVRYLFNNPPGLFNAFIACTPRHPIVHEALRRHARWSTMSPMERWRITRGNTHRPNIGTVLLRDAVRSVVGDAATFECERTGVCGGGIQLFREIALNPDGEYNASGLCTMCDTTHECNFAVADVLSGDVIMKSRIAMQSGHLCPLRCNVSSDDVCVRLDQTTPKWAQMWFM